MRTVLLLASLVAAAAAQTDLGAPGWTCNADLMKKSKSVPTSVHALRPADIEIVGALGDSLTAGNGAGAPKGDLLGVGITYRGLTFSVGGDKTLDEHISMANVLKKFNPDLYGFSIKTGNAYANAHLNEGVPGARSAGILSQANTLVSDLKKNRKDDYKTAWKLVHIFIGANDMCAWCDHQDTESAENYRDNIRKAVQVLQKELPRTIVVLSGMVDVGLLRKANSDEPGVCLVMHSFECECVAKKSVTDQQLADEAKKYAQFEQELQDSGEFDTSDDFTLVIQPFFEGVTDLCRNPDGTVNMDFFAPDCFHFSGYGHAIVGRNLWNNMVQPVGGKTAANLTDSNPLNCPDSACPFIRTTKNSDNCGKYLTPA